MGRRRRKQLDPLSFILSLLAALISGIFALIAAILKPKRNKRQIASRDKHEQPVTMLSDAHSTGSFQLDIKWEKFYQPPERYQIEYADRWGEFSERTIDLARIGSYQGHDYIGVFEGGQFKSLRADRILKVEKPTTTTTYNSELTVIPNYSTKLPEWSTGAAVYRMKSITGNRHWTVDLNRYSCTCPEKRFRTSQGFADGTLGRVCPHMAQAILENLPKNSGWNPELITFLSNPRNVAIGSLL